MAYPFCSFASSCTASRTTLFSCNNNQLSNHAGSDMSFCTTYHLIFSRLHWGSESHTEITSRLYVFLPPVNIRFILVFVGCPRSRAKFHDDEVMHNCASVIYV